MKLVNRKMNPLRGTYVFGIILGLTEVEIGYGGGLLIIGNGIGSTSITS